MKSLFALLAVAAFANVAAADEQKSVDTASAAQQTQEEQQAPMAKEEAAEGQKDAAQ